MNNKYKESITPEEIQDLPLVNFTGEIIVVDDLLKIQAACDYLKQQRLLGFDTESRPSFKKGHVNKLSILQLSSDDKCFIFQLQKTGLQNEIVEILTDTEIIKIGTAIGDDLKFLRHLYHFKSRGFVDLQTIASHWGIADKSLKKMSGIVLGAKISKSQQTSNWEVSELTPAQLLYAATDAWICLKIYKQLLYNEQ